MQWARILDIREYWNKAEEGKISYRRLALHISDLLEMLDPYKDKEIDRKRLVFADFFRKIPDDILAEEFDQWMDLLYDWGDLPINDTEKVCWIKAY